MTSANERPIHDVETLEQARDQIRHLQVALTTARHIGAAVGVVMAEQGLGYDDAFAVLVSASQSLQRKVRDVAEDVLYTGTLPVRPDPA